MVDVNPALWHGGNRRLVEHTDYLPYVRVVVFSMTNQPELYEIDTLRLLAY